MPELNPTPYGSWKSPITSDLIVSGTIRLGQIALDGQDLYWTEMRPSEGGRSVLMRRTAAGQISDFTPVPFNVRTRVHEYGGGSFIVSDGIAYFSNFADQRLYRQGPGDHPQPITPEANIRYADAVFDRHRHRLICIREDHRDSAQEATNTLVSVGLNGDQDSHVLISGCDFYASPRLSPDGSRLAWLSWNHPNMPWDGTSLWMAPVEANGSLGDPQFMAGGIHESIFQPEWSPDGHLHFISDRTGWWNLYSWKDGQIHTLCPKEAEFGQPQWIFGLSTYGFVTADQIGCTYIEKGISHLALLNPTTGDLQPIETPYTVFGDPQFQSGQVIFIGASPTQSAELVRLDLFTHKLEVVRRSSELALEAGYLSIPQVIEFPTEQGLSAYGFFYPPQNQDYTAPTGELPPLLVKSHGGPTAATSTSLNLSIQYWTSRGIGVLDVNYGGSTGYGRAYRQRLQGQWGIVDVDDCVNGARYLVDQGKADRDRLAIDGGSAGGYTTLCALTFREVFKAGASYYGVSDLEALAKDTHKFESRYLDGLIGPYPERQDLYQARSPIHFVEQLSCPVIFFQGLEDAVVPPNQAEMMVQALRQKGLPVAYVAFEGEQHGFRRAETIKRALDGEFYFYSQVFGFERAESIEPVTIENL